MDLWEKNSMSEKDCRTVAGTGISVGTAIVVLAALYFVIKWAVISGMMEAYKKIEEKSTAEFKKKIKQSAI